MTASPAHLDQGELAESQQRPVEANPVVQVHRANRSQAVSGDTLMATMTPSSEPTSSAPSTPITSSTSIVASLAPNARSRSVRLLGFGPNDTAIERPTINKTASPAMPPNTPRGITSGVIACWIVGTKLDVSSAGKWLATGSARQTLANTRFALREHVLQRVDSGVLLEVWRTPPGAAEVGDRTCFLGVTAHLFFDRGP